MVTPQRRRRGAASPASSASSTAVAGGSGHKRIADAGAAVPPVKQPRGSGGGGGGGGGGTSKVGRPRRNLSTEMEKHIRDFEESNDSDSTWFGENWRTRERNLKRLLGDVETRMKSAECGVAECESLKNQNKQLGAIMNLAKYISTYGPDSTGFAQCFDQQKHFLGLAPEVEVKFPGFLFKHRHEARVRESTYGEFFTMLSDKEMQNNGFSDPDVISEMQRSLLSERIVKITKMNTLQDVTKAMALQFPEDISIIPALATGVQEDLQVLHRVVRVDVLALCTAFATMTELDGLVEQLMRAQEALKNKDNKVQQTFKQQKPGNKKKQDITHRCFNREAHKTY